MGAFTFPKLTEPLIPIQGTGLDALPFVVLFGFLLAASVLLWRGHGRRPWLRVLLRALSTVTFVGLIYFSHCFLKFAAYSISQIGWDDLSAFGNLYRLIIPVGFTLVVGPIFCSWICPFGLLQEMTAKLFSPKSRGGKLALLGLLALGTLAFLIRFRPSSDRLTENIPTIWTIALVAILGLVLLRPRLEPWLFRLRYVSLAVFLGLAAFLIFNEGWCVLYVHEVDYAALLACAVILAASAIVPFAWCRYLCPTGVLFSWLGRASLVKDARRCSSACHLSGSCESRCRVSALQATPLAAPPRRALTTEGGAVP